MGVASHRFHQVEATECGLAALSMCASLLGAEIDLGVMRMTFPSSSRGTSVRQLLSIATEVGLRARAVRCELSELRLLNLPAVLHWNMNHFVVLTKIKGNKLRIFDPAVGYGWINRSDASRTFTGIAIELTRTAAFKPRRPPVALRLFDLVKLSPSVRGGLVQSIILSIFMQIYVLASPLFIQIAVDDVGGSGDLRFLQILAAGFSIYAIFNLVAEILRVIVIQRCAATIGWELSAKLFSHLIRLPLSWFHTRRLADALTRFQAVEPIKALIASGLISAGVDGVLSVGTLLFMFIFQPILAGVSFFGYVVSAFARLAVLPAQLRYSAENLSASIDEQSKRIETIRAIQSIKIMAGEAEREALWMNKMGALVAASRKGAVLSQSFSSVQMAIETICFIAVIYIGVVQLVADQLRVGALFAFIAYRAQFIARATSLLDQVINVRLLDTYSYRLADIVLSPTESGGPAGGIVPDGAGALSVENVSFRYSPSEPFVLANLTFNVEAGEFVAITGPSGVGKSTLLKVICGLYPASTGTIRYSGAPLSAWPTAQIRRKIGVVMQDDELLSGSIAENVSFFEEAPDYARVEEALQMASVLDEVKAMPMGLRTYVGDLGNALSGGQRQRLLLARAIYRRPDILLLDEATSHLDIACETRITRALESLRITRIVIAHRPESIKGATRVVELQRPVRI